MKALIDFDILCYSVGFVTQEEPVEVAHTKTDDFIANIIMSTGATDYQGYLSDGKEGNFRFQIDPNYKAHRVQEKPIHYDAIKEYLITAHNGLIAHGMEADDAMGINQNDDTIICTIDKDLTQIPGRHYSWPITRLGNVVREARNYSVTADEGLRYFWKQMITGDRSDNIKGIAGLGERRTEQLFRGVPTHFLPGIVMREYNDQWEDDWQRIYVNNSKLLWIKRTNDQDEKTPAELSLESLSIRKAEQT